MQESNKRCCVCQRKKKEVLQEENTCEIREEWQKRGSHHYLHWYSSLRMALFFNERVGPSTLPMNAMTPRYYGVLD